MNSEELKQYRKTFYENLKKYQKEKEFKELLDMSISETNIEPENSNKVMVCIGSYIEVKEGLGTKQYLTYKDEFNINYRQYCDLETNEIYNVSRDQIKEFELKNKIIYLPIVIYNIQEYYKKYRELRRTFFEELLYDEQEEVVLKLKNNNKKL